MDRRIIKFVAEKNALNEKEKISKILNASICLQIIIGLLGALLLIVFAKNILILLNVSSEYFNKALIGLYAACAGFFFSFLTASLSAAIMGLQLYKITSRITITNNLLLNAGIFIVLFFNGNIADLMILNAVITFVFLIVYYIVAKNKFSYWQIKLDFTKKTFWKLFNFSGFIFVS